MKTYLEREAELSSLAVSFARCRRELRGLQRGLSTLFLISTWVLAARATADGSLHNSALTGASVLSTGVTDQLTVTNGFLYINDTYLYVTGQTFVTTAATTVWDNAGAGKQQKLTAYYVYEMVYQQSPILSTLVISPSPPQVEGNPAVAGNAGISFTIGTTLYSGVTTGEFLGSYITDSNNHVVPFARLGDEVLLEYNITGTTPIPMDTATFSTTDAYPATKTLKPYIDSTNNHTYPVPHSAQALLGLVEFDTTGAAPSMAILNPLAGTPANCNVSAILQATPGVTSPALFARVRIPRNLGANPETVMAFDCSKPATGKTDTLKISYIGYVENVNHVQH